MAHLSTAGAAQAVGGRAALDLLAEGAGEGACARIGRRSCDAAGAVAFHTGAAAWLALDDHMLRGRPVAAAVAATWASSPPDTSVGRVLRSTVAALEVAGRLGLATLVGARSWTCLPATAAAAAVASALSQGLDEAQVAHALALALARAPVEAPWGGSQDAPMADATAARIGVESAAAAAAGRVGELDVLDRDDLLGALCARPLRGAFGGVGSRWLTHTLTHRRFACAPAAQPAVESVAEILARHVKAADKRLRPDQVERVVVRGGAWLRGLVQHGQSGRGPVAVPWSLEQALGVLVVRHGLGADDLTEAVLAKEAARIAAVASTVDVEIEVARTLSAFDHQARVLGPVLAELGWRDARRLTTDARPGEALRGLGLPALRALVRGARLLGRPGQDLGAVDTAEWQLRLPTEVMVYTTRGGRWPERRVLPEGSPGWSWDRTVEAVTARYARDDDAARQQALAWLAAPVDDAAQGALAWLAPRAG